MQTDRERIEALQAEVAEYLKLYAGQPDSYAATVRVGLLRDLAERVGIAVRRPNDDPEVDRGAR